MQATVEQTHRLFQMKTIFEEHPTFKRMLSEKYKKKFPSPKSKTRGRKSHTWALLNRFYIPFPGLSVGGGSSYTGWIPLERTTRPF
jgi:hypothetical protein